LIWCCLHLQCSQTINKRSWISQSIFTAKKKGPYILQIKQKCKDVTASIQFTYARSYGKLIFIYPEHHMQLRTWSTENTLHNLQKQSFCDVCTRLFCDIWLNLIMTFWVMTAPWMLYTLWVINHNSDNWSFCFWKRDNWSCHPAMPSAVSVFTEAKYKKLSSTKDLNTSE